MKIRLKMTTTALLIIVCAQTTNASAKTFLDLLAPSEIKKQVVDQIATQDINFGVDLGSLGLGDNINIGTKYDYDVEASYMDHYYTRIDKWDVNLGINAGEILKDFVDIPFAFSVNRNNSFLFVRQFKSKIKAMEAIPYGPNKLPLNAFLTAKNLKVGDFVSMPADMNIAFSAGAGTSILAPIPVGFNSNVYWIMSGDFTIQVYKLDESHVRVKIITQRGYSKGATAGVRAEFKLMGINLVDHLIERLIDRDFVQAGLSYNPGAQFILDYVFDLKDEKAQEAYNQILNSNFKFKDVVILNQIMDARSLKDKLISTYEKADQIFEEDKMLDPKDRRVQRIFKGFNNSAGHTQHLKLSFFVTSYTKDRSFNENKITFIDKNENNLDFFYPTFSKFIETTLGRNFFELKDQSFQNNFGLIPRFKQEDTKLKNPELGFTLERKDRIFSTLEQKSIKHFMKYEFPTEIMNNIDLTTWMDGNRKYETRIFLQLILKSQGFEFLKNIPTIELREKLFAYVADRKIQEENRFNDFLLLPKVVAKEKINFLAKSLSEILKNEKNDSEDMIKKLVRLNEYTIFNKIGVGFLISLMPKDQLQDLIYAKIDLIGAEIDPIQFEFGHLNYEMIYKELNQVQSRLSNRSYDLRLSQDDIDMEDRDVLNIK